MIAVIIMVTVVGGIGFWTLYNPPGPGPPPSIDTVDSQPTQNQTETTPELTNATSPETNEAPEITNTTEITPETPEFNKTTIIEVTAGELLENVDLSLMVSSDNEVLQAKEWLKKIESAKRINITGVCRGYDESVDPTTNMLFTTVNLFPDDNYEYWPITVSSRIVIVFRNVTDFQKFENSFYDIEAGHMNRLKIDIEGDYLGTTPNPVYTGVDGSIHCWIDNSRIIKVKIIP